MTAYPSAGRRVRPQAPGARRTLVRGGCGRTSNDLAGDNWRNMVVLVLAAVVVALLIV